MSITVTDNKAPDAYRTISEAADMIGAPQHVLRFWETKFSFLRPMKRAGGRRLYRPQDLKVLKGIKKLLHEEGMTIKGVQKLHRQHGINRILKAQDEPEAVVVQALAPSVVNASQNVSDAVDMLSKPDSQSQAQTRETLERILSKLETAQTKLQGVVHKEMA